MMPVNPGDTIVQISSGEEGGGTLYSPGPKQIVAVPSVNELVTSSPEAGSAVNEQGSFALAPTKVKEVTITMDGAYRFIWLMTNTLTQAQTIYTAIYRNGAQVGASHQLVNGSGLLDAPLLVSEDIGGWSVGDLAQVYAWTAGGGGIVQVSNFGLWGEMALLTPQIVAGVVNINGVVPATPTTAAGTSSVATTADITWVQPAGTYDPILSTTVYITKSGVTTTQTFGAVTSARVTGLTSGQTYTFQVTATNLDGESIKSTASAGVLIA